MSDNQHTPGPWLATPGHYAVGRAGMYACRDDMICTLPGYGSDYRTRTANARLIAAAPEMLAALQNTADALDQLMREGTIKIGHPYAPHVRDLIANARAAIAKATGQ